MKIPSKIQNLVWRACTSCLPTLVQLRTKHVAVSTLCPLCQEQDESILHILVTCRVTRKCWDRVGIGTVTPAGTNFFDWCTTVFSVAAADLCCNVATVCWAIWGARNELVWKRKSFNPIDIVAFANRYLDQWRCAQSSDMESSWPLLRARDVVERWTAPHGNSVKLNVDAAMFNSGEQYGIRLVVRNGSGLLIEGRTELFNGQVEPVLAEAIGIREALSWIKDSRWQDVYVETDCLNVVQAIHCSTEMISLFGLVIKDCKKMLANLNNVFVSFIKRSANVVAHSFARAAILYPDCSFSLESIPTELLPSLIAEVVI
ncbi:hypothetical protein CsatA_010887 [Cannabis sativa]